MEETKRIRILRIHPTYAWKWNIKEECCLICQQEFNATCNTCVHPLECVPVVGCCGHTFHLHCMQSWQENNENCPICRNKYEISKIFSNKVSRRF